MINKIQDMNSITYRNLFEDAKKFTIEKQFPLDSYPMNDCEANVSELVKELSGLFFDYTNNYLNHNLNPIITFGGDCANVHFQILRFINDHYRSISANITIGEVLLSEQLGFKFNQNKCVEWLENGIPPIFDCHAWITINNDYILDCTIGTYINTRTAPDSAINKSEELYGGLIFGHADNLQHIAFRNLKGITPKEYFKIKYTPVILGKTALNKLGPRYT
ncbi:hypothetical protein [Kluyvera sichuanensis]|uniref:hypothetical protein n=1 Tax=Kluyvera sichuanensis TaxID=2725494 RepID=UPI0034A44454